MSISGRTIQSRDALKPNVRASEKCLLDYTDDQVDDENEAIHHVLTNQKNESSFTGF